MKFVLISRKVMLLNVLGTQGLERVDIRIDFIIVPKEMGFQVNFCILECDWSIFLLAS